VAQQYLPSALQGEVFWQPGSLGWEGRRRERLQQRRAAQLAAAAELAADQGDVLSSSPDDPQLERWLQRQAAGEGERLDTLRRRFWEGAHWQRHDRVLVLEARSLLWALDPLAATPEGGVVITVGQASDRERLQAQLQVLDALRQPQLLVVPADAPASLRSQLEPGEGPRFDWVVARQPWRGLSAQQIASWIGAVGAQLSADAQWRLLFSTPQMGPATGLQALTSAAGPSLQPLLEELSSLERQQLQQEPNPGQLARQALIDQGWRVEQQHWQESLQLELSEALIARWLAPESTYLGQLNALRDTPLPPAVIEVLQQGFQRHLGQQLPQTVVHTLLRAQAP
jgi:putative ATPase